MYRLPPTLILLVCAAWQQVCAASLWTVNHQSSEIGFIAIQEGNAFTGHFERFDVELSFDPEHLDSSYFRVIIDTGSVNTQSPERDEILRSTDFFDISQWPHARFNTNLITSLGNGFYLASATLQIRDQTLILYFPFQLSVLKQNRSLLSGSGELLINRFDFDLAQGEWRDTRIIGEQVLIRVKLKASKPIRR